MKWVFLGIKFKNIELAEEVILLYNLLKSTSVLSSVVEIQQEKSTVYLFVSLANTGSRENPPFSISHPFTSASEALVQLTRHLNNVLNRPIIREVASEINYIKTVREVNYGK